MSSDSVRQLRRFHVGALPLLELILQRLRLREVLEEFLPPSSHQTVSAAQTLVLLAVNLTLAKDPLYELAQWVESLDLRALGYRQRPAVRFTDDRFARALDELYAADRPSLLTRLAVAAIQAFDVQCDALHNDSTSVKAFGRIPGRTRTGLELRFGHSKDHRPDLKQLVYSLSLTEDGAVPIHHHVYPGNRNDETTHIETWDALRRIHGGADFLYVADCKLCTHKQLAYIVDQGGRAVTVLPDNFLEARRFKDQLRAGPLPKKLLWRRPTPNEQSRTEYFSVFDGNHQTDLGGYALYWFVSSEKRRRDQHSRREGLATAEAALAELAPKLNAYHLKRKADILRAVQDILDKHHVAGLLGVRLDTHLPRFRQRPRGRPGQKVRYRYDYKFAYSLHWSRDPQALRREARTDGVFPLLSTDPSLPPKRVLQAWKFQPRLEKRFAQFKSVHRAAPLLFKKIERVEANMFVFFIALLLQALLERLLRLQLVQRQAPPLKLYPEDRDAPHPTTSQLLKTFEGLSTYVITTNNQPTEEYRDELSQTHRAVLSLLDMTETQFWHLSDA
jgi:transposase